MNISCVQTRFLLLFAVLLAGACENGGRATVVGTLERDRITIPAELSEPVVALHVHEGALVTRGDRILQLDTARAETERDRLAALRAEADARLDERVRGPREERIHEARATLAAAEAQFTNAARELERIDALATAKLASAAQRDAALATRDRAAAERDATRASLEALLQGTTVEELDQARAQLEAASAAVRIQELVIERLSVTAPRDAHVEALPYKIGARPAQGAEVAVLLASGAPHARVHIPAESREAYRQGSKVTVRVSGFGEFAGHVRWIAADAVFTPYYALTEHDRGRLSYAAEIELAGDDAESLPAGVPVEVIAAE